MRGSRAPLTATLKRLAKRWFLLRSVQTGEGASLVQPRHAIRWLGGADDAGGAEAGEGGGGDDTAESRPAIYTFLVAMVSLT